MWAIARTKPCRETTAAANLKRQGFEYYLPRYMASDQPKPQILFPGYIFIDIFDEWRAVRSTIGILDFLYTAEDKPAELRPADMALLRGRETGVGILVVEPFKPGQRLRVVRGWAVDQLVVFTGMSAKARCKVLLDMLGVAAKVDLPSRDLVAA